MSNEAPWRRKPAAPADPVAPEPKPEKVRLTEEERKARKRAWNAKNREKMREKKRAWCNANQEKARKYVRAHRAANKEKLKETEKISPEIVLEIEERKLEKDRARRAASLEKAREQHRARRAANREKIREQHRARRAANREKVREKDRARRAANREKIREQHRARRAANREKVREKDRAYYARKKAKKEAANALPELRQPAGESLGVVRSAEDAASPPDGADVLANVHGSLERAQGCG